MFDLDAGKLLVIAIVALIFIGPKELPRVLRQAGQMVGKLRRMAADFQTQFMDAVKEAELDGLREDLAKMADQAKIDVDFDPIHTVRNEITEALVDKPVHADGPLEIEGVPSLDMAGLPQSAEAESAGFAEAGVAPIAEHAGSVTGPSPEPQRQLVAPELPEPEPAPLRKIGGM